MKSKVKCYRVCDLYSDLTIGATSENEAVNKALKKEPTLDMEYLVVESGF